MIEVYRANKYTVFKKDETTLIRDDIDYIIIQKEKLDLSTIMNICKEVDDECAFCVADSLLDINPKYKFYMEGRGMMIEDLKEDVCIKKTRII